MRVLLLAMGLLLMGWALAQDLTVKVDDFAAAGPLKWSTSMSPDYYKGDTGQKGLQIVTDPERGPVLACDVRFVDPAKSEPCFISRDLDRPVPVLRVKQVSFWYKLQGDVALDPEMGFKVRLRTSPTDFTDYDVLTGQAPTVGKWVHCTLDTRIGGNVRNIWGKLWGSVKQFTFRLDDVDDRNAHFTLLVSDLTLTVDEAGVEKPYVPHTYTLRPDSRLDVLLIKNAAAGYYRVEDAARALDPKAAVSSYPFKGLHFGLDLFGFPKTLDPLLKTDLIVLVDVDPFVLTPTQATWLADLVQSGAGLVFFGGGNTLANSRDFKVPLRDTLPVTFTPQDPQFVSRKAKVAAADFLPEALRGADFGLANSVQKLAAKPGATVILQGDDRPLVVAAEVGKGRVVVVNAQPNLDRTDDLFLSASYPALLTHLLAWAARRPTPTTAFAPTVLPTESLPTAQDVWTIKREGFFPLITMAGGGSSGHYLDEAGLRADVTQMRDYGFNTIAVGGLSNLARRLDQPTASERNTLALERISRELGLANLYEYTGFNAVHAEGPPKPCVFSPEFPAALAAKLQPQLDVARRTPNLLSVKILDEPTIGPKNLDYCTDCQRVFQARYGIPLRKFEDIPADATYERWAFADFLGYYVAEGYRQAYEFKRQPGAKFDLLVTYMSTGLGYNRPLSDQEDSLDWSRWADRFDFDVYPYFYPDSQKIRMVRAAWCMAYARQLSQHLGKPWGFYVELDDRNWPFQQNPKEASAECAYEALLHGADYLNSFIHLPFATGCDSRPERWAWTGQELRKIQKLGPLLTKLARPPASVAFVDPTAQTFVTNQSTPRAYAYACVSQGFGNVDVLPEEVALEQKAWPYRVLVLLGCDLLHADMAPRLEQWVRAGGLLVVVKLPTRNHRGAALAWPVAFPEGKAGAAYVACSLGKGRIAKLGFDLEQDYRSAIEGGHVADAGALRQRLAAVLGLTGARPTAVVADKPGQMEVGVRQDRRQALVIVVNHDAAPNTGTVTVRALPFRPATAQDAATGRPYPVQATADGASFSVKLPARQAAMVLLSAKAGR